MSNLGHSLAIYWRGYFSVIWPCLCLLVFIVETNMIYRCIFVTLLMAGYWVTECIPLPATSMLPIILFPLLGILDTETTCMTYFKETNVMFLGGIMIAIAVEYSGLHIRVAMITLLCIGCSPRKLHFGLVAMTTFISMWISNTAATAMMCPIIVAVLEEMEAQGLGEMYIPVKKQAIESPPAEPLEGVKPPKKEEEEEEKRPSDVTVAYFLSAAYASSIGGIGTLVGTGTNLTYRGLYESRFPGSKEGINFTSWMLFCMPAAAVMSVLTYLWLQVLFLGLFRPKSKMGILMAKGKENRMIVRQVILEKYKELGSVSWHELWVGILFVCVVLLWFFRSPGFMSGWPTIFTKLAVKDATSALGIVFLMFLIPAKPTFCRYVCGNAERPKKNSTGLLTWKVINSKMPWGLLFLLGGGFALAEGAKRSGMSEYLGNSLQNLSVLPPLVCLFFVIVFTSVLTEFSSNVAIANIILPVLIEMSVAIKLHPMYLTFPAALCCSFAFVLPVGTPPNAIVAGLANIQTGQMAKGGMGVKVITTIVLMVLWPTYGQLIYGLNKWPDWAAAPVIKA